MMKTNDQNKEIANLLDNVLDSINNGNTSAATILILQHQLELCHEDLKAYREMAARYDEKIRELEMSKQLLSDELTEISSKLGSKYAYYYVANTTDEYGRETIVPKYFKTLDAAKDELKEHCDWYRSKGTGRIYGVKFTIPVTTTEVFRVD